MTQAETSAIESHRPGLRSTRCRILLADDDPVARKALGYVLRREGHTVDEVSDGLELLDHIDRCLGSLGSDATTLPDLIVTDVCMPRVGGLDVLAGLRLSRVAIPIILVTGFDRREARARADRLGPVAVLSKPLSVSELLAAISKAVVRS